MTLDASVKKFFESANQTAEAVNRQIIYITQRNLNLGLDLAKSLASARDPSEIVKLQASFWWKQFNEFTAQAEEVRRRLFGLGAVEPEPSTKPESTPQPEPTPEPRLEEPVTSLHAPQQQEHRLAAQDPAIPRAKQKPAKQKVGTPTLAAQTPTTPRVRSWSAESRVSEERCRKETYIHLPTSCREPGGAKASSNADTHTPDRSRRCYSAT